MFGNNMLISNMYLITTFNSFSCVKIVQIYGNQPPSWPLKVLLECMLLCSTLPQWTGLTCVTNRILQQHVTVKARSQRHCDFCLAFSWITHSGGAHRKVTHTEEALWRSPCTNKLKPPASIHVSEPSWKWIPQPRSNLQITATPTNTWL